VCTKVEVPKPAKVLQRAEHVTVYDADGIKHAAEVLKVDIPNDLCLLRVDHLRGRAIVLARRSPIKHARIYSVGAPMGVWSPSAAVVVEGRYSGRANDDAVYTMPAAPGSSGSPITNSRGQLVGMVSRGLSPSWHVVFSPTLEAIHEFLQGD